MWLNSKDIRENRHYIVLEQKLKHIVIHAVADLASVQLIKLPFEDAKWSRVSKITLGIIIQFHIFHVQTWSKVSCFLIDLRDCMVRIFSKSKMHSLSYRLVDIVTECQLANVGSSATTEVICFHTIYGVTISVAAPNHEAIL